MAEKIRRFGNPVKPGDDLQLTPDAQSNGHALPGMDATLVRAQLERILASAPFRNSKRYPALLRYIVERELNGTSSDLKERTIGIDVFGREPSYDPGADPVVRISAGEVRKRLAQYYAQYSQEAGGEHRLRIELPIGSYHPVFVVPTEPRAPVLPPPAPTPAGVDVLPINETKGTRNRSVGIAVFAAISILVGLVWYSVAGRPTALDLFWRPVMVQSRSVLLCLGHSGAKVENPSSAYPHPSDPNQTYVAWWDAETLARLAGLIQSKGSSYRLLKEDEATFSDFQQSPAVLIGAFNDQWTLELMSHMRYTFQRSGNLHWIADRDRPSFQDWKVDFGQQDAQGNMAIREDYAIISRVANPRTGFITVTVAGLWGYGTLAAGRFLTDPKYLEEFSKRTGFKLGKGNIQMVVRTEVIKGKSGPPTVLATASW